MAESQTIRTLFAQDIDRKIEEVIKVDQADTEVIQAEISEYVATDAIKSHYRGVLREYRQTQTRKTEGVAVWVSGFFGSGKSSFAKMLGLSIENRDLDDKMAGTLFAEQVGDDEITVQLQQIAEHLPTHSVVFDVSTDRGIRSGNQTLTEIMYRQLLKSLGYATELDLSELEIALEAEGRLARFAGLYEEEYNSSWDDGKNVAAFALGRASAIMAKLEPQTYATPESWNQSGKERFDPSPNKLADRCTLLMARRQPDKSLMFVIDEVGQFVARDVQKMLDLQGIVQALGVEGRGKHWIVVTSQERLGEMVSGLDDKRIELRRLMDRFPQQVHLEPSDITEVTSKRVLSKKAPARQVLGALFDEHQARLAANTRLSADVKLPDLTRTSFIDLYPLLPYQVELIIDVVSGLRTQGGTAKHVGGANRTIIKLAQQLLVHPKVALADKGVGQLAQLDHIYDLVEGNIASDVRAKIAGIQGELGHPLAAPVAKAICLLQFVKTVHRTPENIAAALYPEVGADSQLAEVKEALQELETAQKVRRSDDGYRIPSPAEDDWERQRNEVNPSPGDAHRIHIEAIKSFWSPQPSHTLAGTKTFKAGLSIGGRPVVDGDVTFALQLADDPTELAALAEELRTRSQTEKQLVHWAAALSETIGRHTREIYRSKDILARKEREARTNDEATLVNDEKQRQRRHEGELKLALKSALLGGSVYFRGNDRSPDGTDIEVGKAASSVLETVLPEVFTRFEEAAARTPDLRKGTDALLKAANLQGLPNVFTSLHLLGDNGGKTIFELDEGPLQEVMGRIKQRHQYGETVSGRYLTEEFEKEPYGWEYEAVRLFVLCLLRSGSIEGTSKGQPFDTATSNVAADAFTNNPAFRAASFRPTETIDYGHLVEVSELFRSTFGREVKEINQPTVVSELRAAAEEAEDLLADTVQVLVSTGLPGADVLGNALDQLRSIRRGSADNAIGTFKASHNSIKDATTQAAQIKQALTEPALARLQAGRAVLNNKWPFLESEPDVGPEFKERAEELADLLDRDTFYRQIPKIDQHTQAIETEYQRRYDEAMASRVAAYEVALGELRGTAGWADLADGVQDEIAAPIERRTQPYAHEVAIPQLREEREACPARLQQAVNAIYEQQGPDVEFVSAASYFEGGIANEEQLKEALKGLREECERLIGEGKTVIVS